MRMSLLGKLLGTAALVALLGISQAHAAANSSVSIIFNSAACTAISYAPTYPTGAAAFIVPVAPGTMVAKGTATPANWSGVITLSGADASQFALNGIDIVVGAAAIATPGTRTVNVACNP
jgi:hypothetical protein